MNFDIFLKKVNDLRNKLKNYKITFANLEGIAENGDKFEIMSFDDELDSKLNDLRLVSTVSEEIKHDFEEVDDLIYALDCFKGQKIKSVLIRIDTDDNKYIRMEKICNNPMLNIREKKVDML